MALNCYVPGCITRQRTQKGIIKFHLFPRDPKLSRIWTIKIRSGKHPTKSSRVCSRHFLDEDYEPMTTGNTKVLKKGAVPSLSLPPQLIKHLVLLPEPDIKEEPMSPPVAETSYKLSNVQPINLPAANQIKRPITTCDAGIQTDAEPVQTETMRYDELSNDDLVFFTGLDMASFKVLTDYIDMDSKVNKYSQYLSSYDQLILTLLKCRHKFEFKVIAKMYGIHRIIVQEIFVLWINIMYTQFKSTDMWALRDAAPAMYTAIIYCCEIPCETNNSDFHVVLMSEAKRRHTIKYLVATDEKGMVIFCSCELFGGSISDRQAITQCGILQKLRSGDSVLSQTNFGIQEIEKQLRVKFECPNESRDKIKAQMHCKKIANMARKFNILKGVFPAILMPHAAQIVYVVNILVNFLGDDET